MEVNMSDLRKKKFIRYTIIYCVIYLLVLALPGLTIVPVDYILETISGIEYADGWTPGVMIYTGLTIILPVIYIITLFIFMIKKNPA
jgi:hypothetical protein